MVRLPRVRYPDGECGGRREGTFLKRATEEAQFKLLVQWISDYAIFMLDPDGVVATWNRGAQKITGYAEDEALGRHYSQFFPEEDRKTKPAALLAKARELGSIDDHGWRVRKDGTRYWADAVITAVYDDQKRLAGFAKITRDLTERLEAQANEKRLRRIADVVPVIVWITDPDGSLVYLNPRWSEYTGAPRERAMGTGWLEFIHPDDQDRARRAWTVGRDNPADHESELRVRGADGVYRWFLSRGVPIFDEAGRVEAYFGTTVDVDKRTRQLRESLEELDSFSYTASHDLRAPLRALEGHAHILLRDHGGQLDARAREHLERIKRAARRMDALIHDLLIYTTLSRTDIAPEPVDLDPLASAVLAENGWKDDVSVASPLGAVRGQRELLSQALENLVDNARKFVPAGRKTEVRVRAEARGPNLRLWVEDNGTGIEPELLSKIFKPFERGHAGRHAGTGIGLAIVKRTASRLGGSVGVESEPGRGSRFWIELPRA